MQMIAIAIVVILIVVVIAAFMYDRHASGSGPHTSTCGCAAADRHDMHTKVPNWPTKCKWTGKAGGCKDLQNKACSGAGFCFDTTTKGAPWCYSCA